MKVITSYKLRTKAEEDRIFLMQRGIATIVFGNVGPRANDHYNKEPITLAVQDLQALQAEEMLATKYYPDPLPGKPVVKKPRL